GRRAAVGDAGEHVAVLPVDGEAVVHLAVAGPPVLVEQRRVVERRELDEAVVHLPVHAPRRRLGGEVAQVAAAAADHRVDGAAHRAGVARPLRRRAPPVVDRARPLVVVDVAVEGEVDAVPLP
ncbi:Os09g0506150, partial [Oryza sativa Japonica Group]